MMRTRLPTRPSAGGRPAARPNRAASGDRGLVGAFALVWPFSVWSVLGFHGGAELFMNAGQRRADRVDWHLQLLADIAIAAAIDIKQVCQSSLPLVELRNAGGEQFPVLVADGKELW